MTATCHICIYQCRSCDVRFCIHYMYTYISLYLRWDTDTVSILFRDNRSIHMEINIQSIPILSGYWNIDYYFVLNRIPTFTIFPVNSYTMREISKILVSLYHSEARMISWMKMRLGRSRAATVFPVNESE